MNRRTFVTLGGGGIAAVALGGCPPAQPMPTDTDPTATTPPTSEKTSPEPTTTPTTLPDPVRSDGNVLREYGWVKQAYVPVAWRTPRGSADLVLDGASLVLSTALHGTWSLGPADLGFGEGPERISMALGCSVLDEARAVLGLVTGA